MKQNITKRVPSPEAVYVNRLRAGDLCFQRCGECAGVIFYPRVACPRCGSMELSWETSERRGVIYSVTEVPHRDGRADGVALVTLTEGFRVMAGFPITGPDDRLMINDEVLITIECDDQEPRLVVRADV